MTLRVATQSDQPAIDRFLRDHLGTSMFLLSNLRLFGPTGGAFYRAMRFWIEGKAEETGVVALSTTGTLMPQLPSGDWAAVRELLSGETCEGIIGDGPQVRGLLKAFELEQVPTNLTEHETLYELPLDALRMPEVTGFELARLDAWREIATAWRAAYHGEVLGTPEAKRLEAAKRDIEGYVQAGSHRILQKDGQPVAMTGFNATLPEAVQIGGVYTPPELRGRHYARKAVALHLAEARRKGFPHAILFAVAPDAMRAYESLGFTETGAFSLVIFNQKQRLA